MKTSVNIGNIAPALLKAQSLMGGAVKEAKNPFFKSSYASLGSVLEACKDLLNKNGIAILQPHGSNGNGWYVETLLLHESGEWVSSETPVVCAKQNDPQALGSAISYGRRYGLQSFLSMPAEDDDGENAMSRETKGNLVNMSTPANEPKKANSWRKAKPQAVAVAAEVKDVAGAAGLEY